ncbi:hypothetical protein SAY86_028343 [Trapa natans]|uniref:Uncharacterized protein n=1 Tax=Trapa natans TaxID=22666 RepID=A0AAN7M100_TRANT|nr:hypothetical protein SAY86_028343 [Trapa natans]
MRDGCDRITNVKLMLLCMYAVNRSCGGLVDISIKYFGNDRLLSLITTSCIGIKRLCLVSCNNVSDEGLCETAAKLGLLEQLELSHCQFFERPSNMWEAIVLTLSL